MKVRLSSKPLDEIRSDVIVLPVPAGTSAKAAARPLGSGASALARRLERSGFDGKVGKIALFADGDRDVVAVGVGDGKDTESWRRAAAAARGACANARARSVTVRVPGKGARLEARAAALVEGIELSAYRFDTYRSKPSEDSNSIRTVTLALVEGGVTAGVRASVARAQAVDAGVALARDLVNEPPSVKTPNHLAKVARRIARADSLSCEVWRGARLEKEKMNGILAVARGSAEPGALIHLTYRPARRARGRIAVVGKGITFDSGGLSLKPAKSMETMKLDMAGAAAVLGLMQALPALAPAVEVHGYIASAENLPGGRAQKPGDVIRFRNGKTAEVLNTDAEGRLVLADALCLAAEQKFDAVIDLATLTGACMVALGTKVAGVMGTDEDLIAALREHGDATGEALWQLPLVEDYNDDIRSSVADIKNIGSMYAGTITAALFLRAFAGDQPWAHLDIAGPAFSEGGGGRYTPRGGTGFGVRLLASYVASLG